VVIEGDLLVSRLHAKLERIGGAWTIVDDGLSRNGTFVNGQRVIGRSGCTTETRSAWECRS
jgi:pSer/pThr/pTyr-binding forkhead associated (FHA) protein